MQRSAEQELERQLAATEYALSVSLAERGSAPNLPAVRTATAAQSVVLSDIQDEETMTFPGSWDTDSRLCLEVKSPNTAMFLGMVLEVQTNEG